MVQVTGFITNPAQTAWVVPSQWSGPASIDGIAAGGAGGWGGNLQGVGTVTGFGGGGGAGGGWGKLTGAESFFSAGQTVGIKIGAGGTAAAAAHQNGGVGGDTWVKDSGGTYRLLVHGGGGGISGQAGTSTGGNGGVGGTMAIGSYGVAGGHGGNNGTNPGPTSYNGGGGGAGGDPSLHGVTIQAGSGGGGANNVGTEYGCGGGGGITHSGTVGGSTIGGAGGAGYLSSAGGTGGHAGTVNGGAGTLGSGGGGAFVVVYAGVGLGGAGGNGVNMGGGGGGGGSAYGGTVASGGAGLYGAGSGGRSAYNAPGGQAHDLGIASPGAQGRLRYVYTVPAPSGLSCGTATTSSITAQWGAVGGALSYTLQWRKVGAGGFTTIAGILGTSQVISGLSAGTQYEWQVEAILSGGPTGFSVSEVCTTLTVPAPPPAPPSLNRWRGQVGINWNGLALVGDAFAGVIGLSDFQNYTEYGNVMRMLVTSPPLQSDRKRIFVPRFEIDMQVGGGTVGLPEVAPVMMLDYSKNGGKTFVGLQKWRSFGAVGQYRRRLRWLNLGESRAWVFRLQCTDNQRRQIIGAYADWFVGQG